MTQQHAAFICKLRRNIALDGEVRLGDLQRWLTWASSKGYVAPGVTPEQMVDMRFQLAASGANRDATR